MKESYLLFYKSREGSPQAPPLPPPASAAYKTRQVKKVLYLRLAALSWFLLVTESQLESYFKAKGVMISENSFLIPQTTASLTIQ